MVVSWVQSFYEVYQKLIYLISYEYISLFLIISLQLILKNTSFNKYSNSFIIIFLQVIIKIFIQFIFQHQQLNKMADNKDINLTEQKPILIYYFVRGKMQPIRNLLCYLKVSFHEIFIDKWQSQKELFPEEVRNILKNLKLNKNLLPLLIHQGLQVYEQYPISNYLCRRYNREDLFGLTIRQRASLQEMLQIFFKRQPSMMNQMFSIAQFAYTNSQEVFNEYLRSRYRLVMYQSSYIKQICEYLIRQKQPKFVFNNITLIDFFFLESCSYMIGIFDKIDQKYRRQLLQKPSQTANSSQSLQVLPIEAYINILRQYKARLMKLDFYQQNKNYLQSFSIISNLLGMERVEGLRKIWQGNPKYTK